MSASEVVVVNVNNPRQPAIVARVELDGYGDGVDVRGKYLYAATGHHSRSGAHRSPSDPGYGRGHGLEIFDVSDPAHPQFASRVKFPPLYSIGNDMWSVTVADGHAFVADTYNGIFVVEVTDANHPTIIGHRKLTSIDSTHPSGFVAGLAVTKDSIYVAGGATDLHVVDAVGIASAVPRNATQSPMIPPHQLAEPSERFHTYHTSGQVHAVEFIGDRAIVACGHDGVHVVDFSIPVKRLSKFKTLGFATDISVSNESVLVAAGTDGLLICEISRHGELHEQGRYQVSGRAIKQVEVAIPGKYVLIQVGANNLHIVDISNPSAPRRVLDEKRPGLLYGDQLMRGLAQNRYACAFWHVSGLHWFDMSSDPEPIYSGDNYPLRIGAANGLVEHQGKTLATLRGGYVLLDRHERRPLADLTVQNVGSRRQHPGKPTIFGDRLYAANRATGSVTIVDISNIEKPKLIEQLHIAGNPGRVQVHQGTLVIPAGYSGLLFSSSTIVEAN